MLLCKSIHFVSCFQTKYQEPRLFPWTLGKENCRSESFAMGTPCLLFMLVSRVHVHAWAIWLLLTWEYILSTFGQENVMHGLIKGICFSWSVDHRDKHGLESLSDLIGDSTGPNWFAPTTTRSLNPCLHPHENWALCRLNYAIKTIN